MRHYRRLGVPAAPARMVCPRGPQNVSKSGEVRSARLRAPHRAGKSHLCRQPSSASGLMCLVNVDDKLFTHLCSRRDAEDDESCGSGNGKPASDTGSVHTARRPADLACGVHRLGARCARCAVATGCFGGEHGRRLRPAGPYLRRCPTEREVAPRARTDGTAAPQGRAFDFAATVNDRPVPNMTLSAGSRTVDGGADVTSVYTFAWLNAAIAKVGVRF